MDYGAKKANDDVINALMNKAAAGDQSAINVLDMIDEKAVDPKDTFRLLELYDAGR